jgi:hypothetical protein
VGHFEWTDYSYELDVFPILATDTNIIFRYTKNNDTERFYDLHAYSGGDISLAEFNGILDKEYKTNFIMDPNKGYRFRIEAIGPYIKVFSKEIGSLDYVLVFDVFDSSPILNGKVGLRIGLNNTGYTKILFDNITLTDLSIPTPTPTPTSTPTPTPTPFPYFSQIDPLWKNKPYNHLNSTIGQVGCALSSAAMVLTSHGLDKIPYDDQLIDLTPETLNNWFNSETSQKRWGRNGALNWLALTELARDLHASDAALYSKLEFNLYEGDKPDFTSTINSLLNTVALIFKESNKLSPSGKHFYTATSVIKEDAVEPIYTYTVYDPYDVNRKMVSTTTDTIQAAYHYQPTNSNLSFVWINADPQLNLLLNNQHQQYLSNDPNFPIQTIPNSTFMETGALVDDINPIDHTPAPYNQFTLKYPESGYYQFVISTQTAGDYEYELYLYDKIGDSQVFTKKPRLLAETLSYTLVIDQDNVSNSYLVKNNAFTNLYQKLNEAKNAGYFIDSKTYEVLYKFLTNTEKVYYQDQDAGIQLLNTFITHVTNDNKQRKLSNPGYILLKTESDTLVTQL